MLYTGIFLFLLISCIIGLICNFLIESKKRTTQLEAEVKAKDISRIIESYVEDLNIWGTLLDEYGEDIIDDFDDLAEGFWGQSDVITCVQLAPDGVVTYMHPYEGNEAAMGHDLFADPARVEEATLARETGSIILSGPLDLKQGGRGLISRIPIYSNVSDEPDHFWGFAMFVMSIDEINKQLGLEQFDTEGYDYRLYRPSDDGQLVCAESTSDALDDAVFAEISLPTNITWEFAVYPKNGWLDRGSFIGLCFVGFIVFLLGMTFADIRLKKKEDVEKELENQRALNSALKEAEIANRAKSEFLSKMSHDIRTPINGVIGMTHIAMKKSGDSEHVEDCLRKIDNSSQTLLSLVNDVLDMSKLDAGSVVVSNTSFDLISVLEECVSQVRELFQDKNILFVVDLSGIRHSSLIGDEAHLRQIMLNILGNSVKFMGDSGEISFSVSEKLRDDEHAVYSFTFADTGIGISEEFLPHIFEEFSQDNIENSRTTYNGTGLGMAITKRYVDILGGTIEVESKLNRGTCFLVCLPMTIDASNSKGSAGGDAVFSLSGKKILVAEDNELNAEIAQEILEDEGAIVTLAQNGQIALDTFRDSDESSFDAILMDIMMPEMNGLEATRAIRSLDRDDARNIPIVAMTANAFEEDKRSALEAGMNAHLAKPINVDLLIKTLTALIGKNPSAQ
jgi:signal transduction histidine kinase/ActR/RegA family two-component response regulator